MTPKFKAHPWHGISIGKEAPKLVTAFIEIVPTDTIKYEIDKESGYMKVDRPQKFSNVVPSLYGFIPQTYCDEKVAEFAKLKTGRENMTGDGDPLDICVLTQRTVNHSDIILQAIPIGGFRMIDKGEADDKIIAVLKGDEVYEQWQDIKDCPPSIINRLKHYFLTYKGIPEAGNPTCEITHTYGRDEAFEVIKRSQDDYKAKFQNAKAEQLENC
jgi:inorganic pyrophosphatase